ncbi:MAG: helix-turn-helix transcriptional regulator [Faecalibacterium sp.]|nr:helix-turn-helix transcriptional regulator [Faecalibacterium sp.]
MNSSAGYPFCAGASLESERRKNVFKDNLISLRKIHGYSQDELAEKIGVTRQTLSKYETGVSHS